MSEINIVEPVNFNEEMLKVVQERVDEKLQNAFLSDAKKAIDKGEDVFIKLIALANVSKEYGYDTVTSIILDVIKSRYNSEYQTYLKA